MARRKRKEDEPDWVPPEFDEVGYMRQEIQGAHAAIATIGWAVIGAVVALLLYAVLPVLAFFAGIAVGFGMYFVFPLIGINTDGFKRRDWVGHGITYFFSWLAFWILLLNPPFSDHTVPTIQVTSVSSFAPPAPPANLTCATTDVVGDPTRGLSIGSNSSIFILFRATDNVGLSVPSIDVLPGNPPPPSFQVTPMPVSGSSQCFGHGQEKYLGGTYSAVFLVSGSSSYAVSITATDSAGNSAAVTFKIYLKP